MMWIDIVSSIGLPMLGYGIRVLVGIRTELATLSTRFLACESDYKELSSDVQNIRERVLILENKI